MVGTRSAGNAYYTFYYTTFFSLSLSHVNSLYTTLLHPPHSSCCACDFINTKCTAGLKLDYLISTRDDAKRSTGMLFIFNSKSCTILVSVIYHSSLWWRHHIQLRLIYSSLLPKPILILPIGNQSRVNFEQPSVCVHWLGLFIAPTLLNFPQIRKSVSLDDDATIFNISSCAVTLCCSNQPPTLNNEHKSISCYYLPFATAMPIWS